MPDDPTSVVAAADRIAGAVHGLGDRFDTLREETKAETKFLRKVLKVLAVSVVFDICLSVVAFGFGWEIHNVAAQAHSATSGATAAHNAAVASCKAGNDFRGQDRQLWQQLLSLSTGPQTPAQAVATAKFVAYLNVHDALRDCNAIK